MTTAIENESTLPAAGGIKFRDDLEITERKTTDGQVFVIHDPVTSRFCQFGEIEYTIAQECDGTRSLEQIRQRVESRFTVALPIKTLAQFVEKLGALNLLESDEFDAKPKPSIGRVRGNALHLRIKLFDPDRLLAQLLRPLGFIYTGAFLYVSAALILAAGVVGEDIDPEDPLAVTYAFATRNHPEQGVWYFADSPYFGVGTEAYHVMGDYTGRVGVPGQKITGGSGIAVYSCLGSEENVTQPRPGILTFRRHWPKDIQEKVLSNWEKWGFRATDLSQKHATPTTQWVYFNKTGEDETEKRA